jgi:hypothetical protein
VFTSATKFALVGKLNQFLILYCSAVLLRSRKSVGHGKRSFIRRLIRTSKIIDTVSRNYCRHINLTIEGKDVLT